MKLLRRSVLIAPLAVGLLLGGGREAAAWGSFYTSRNPCLFSPFGPIQRCNAFGCFCSTYDNSGRFVCSPPRPYWRCDTSGCGCSAIIINFDLFLTPLIR